MESVVRKYKKEDIKSMIEIWNFIVEEGNSFPQTDKLDLESGEKFFSSQTYTGVAVIENEIVGLYILHPNNIGRCGHISNASFAVRNTFRGHKIGEALVRDSLMQAKAAGFKIMQFNAVVLSNIFAHRLYEKIGFKKIGTVKGGFLLKDGRYEDIVLYYIEL